MDSWYHPIGDGKTTEVLRHERDSVCDVGDTFSRLDGRIGGQAEAISLRFLLNPFDLPDDKAIPFGLRPDEWPVHASFFP